MAYSSYRGKLLEKVMNRSHSLEMVCPSPLIYVINVLLTKLSNIVDVVANLVAEVTTL